LKTASIGDIQHENWKEEEEQNGADNRDESEPGYGPHKLEMARALFTASQHAQGLASLAAAPISQALCLLPSLGSQKSSALDSEEISMAACFPTRRRRILVRPEWRKCYGESSADSPSEGAAFIA
jgi:hypothetical protein